jgi:UDP-N-acetylmuramate dehydrogenase
MTNALTLTTNDGSITIRRDQPMSRYTTFRIGGPADFLVTAVNAEQVQAANEWAARAGVPVTVVGGGSNLLVGDGGIRGLVLLVRASAKTVEEASLVEDLGDQIRIRVPAQMHISRLGHRAARSGWAGLEWAAGLPGMLGGALVNNAGAHGSEITDHLESIEVLTGDRRIETWTRDRLSPRYRHTVLKAAPRPRRWIVLQATFVLPRGNTDELTARADDYARWRRSAQPTGACAGSVFTNPDGTYAGLLIDQAGLKGRQIGGVRVSELHGNFLVNTGGGTAADVRELIAVIQETVHHQTGIQLVPEIEQVGER